MAARNFEDPLPPAAAASRTISSCPYDGNAPDDPSRVLAAEGRLNPRNHNHDDHKHHYQLCRHMKMVSNSSQNNRSSR